MRHVNPDCPNCAEEENRVIAHWKQNTPNHLGYRNKPKKTSWYICKNCGHEFIDSLKMRKEDAVS